MRMAGKNSAVVGPVRFVGQVILSVSSATLLLPKELNFRTIFPLLPKESEDRILYFSCPQIVQSGFRCVLISSLLSKELYFHAISLLLPKELNRHHLIWLILGTDSPAYHTCKILRPSSGHVVVRMIKPASLDTAISLLSRYY